MEKFSKKISQYFLAHALIEQNQLEWCAYSFEVLLEQVVSFCVLFAFGTWLVGPLRALTFLIAMAFLRSKTNGYHASTYLACLSQSIIYEVTSFTVSRYLTTPIEFYLCIFASLTIFLLAPTNNQNAHFSKSELLILKKESLRRVLYIDVLTVLLLYINSPLSVFLVLALSITAFLLILAHLGFGIQ